MKPLLFLYMPKVALPGMTVPEPVENGGFPGEAGSVAGVTVTIPLALGAPNLIDRLPRLRILFAGLRVALVEIVPP